MSDFDIHGINLNLLPALDALLSEGSVSRAARRVGVSQSAMSHSLARLRELLDDPLLVTAGRKMVPTPRATRIAGPLRIALEALGGALSSGAQFDPETSERELVIASFDYFEMIALPELVEFLRERAPNMTVRIERLSEEVARRLLSGELDLVIGASAAPMPGRLKRRPLFEDRFAVIARSGHPRLRRGLDLDRYLDLDHVLVALERGRAGVVDRALAAMGHRRRVSVRVPHFVSAPLIVARSEAICTLPLTVALRARELFGVRVLEPPLELPAVGVAAYWPPQLDDEPAHRWFREQFFAGRASSRALRRRLRDG